MIQHSHTWAYSGEKSNLKRYCLELFDLRKAICSVWLPSGDMTTVICKWPAAAHRPGRQAGGMMGTLAGFWLWLLKNGSVIGVGPFSSLDLRFLFLQDSEFGWADSKASSSFLHWGPCLRASKLLPVNALSYTSPWKDAHKPHLCLHTTALTLLSTA